MDGRQPRRRSRTRVYRRPGTALGNRLQLTTDGLRAHLDAVGDAFAWEIDYAMLVKQYGDGSKSPERKYSPSEYQGSKKIKITGNRSRTVSTSYVERQNLTMRMWMRRSMRLTNGFSKKIENHAHAVTLHFMFYNSGSIHKTLRVTPAMEAGFRITFGA